LRADPERRKSLDKIVFCCLLPLVFIVPWEENFMIEGFESFSRIFGALAFLAGVAAVALSPRSVKPWHRALIVLGLFVVWNVASMVWSMDRDVTLSRSISYVLLLVFAWLIFQFSDSPLRQRWLMLAYISGTGLALTALFFGVVRLADSTGEGMRRFTAQGANPNGLALALVTSINFAVYLATRSGQKRARVIKLAYWVFIVAAACGVFYTGSRCGALGLGIAVFFTPVVMFRVLGWKPAVIFVLCLAVIGVLVVQLVPSGNLARVAELQTAKSFQDRVAAWQNGLTKWTEQPLQGFGSATNGGMEVAHNTLVTVLVDDGLVGLGLYVAFWLLLLVALLSLPKVEKSLWFIVFASYSPAFLSGSNEYNKNLWLLCAMALAQVATLRRMAVPSARAAPSPTARLRPV
jgi:O-antigen ligase